MKTIRKAQGALQMVTGKKYTIDKTIRELCSRFYLEISVREVPVSTSGKSESQR